MKFAFSIPSFLAYASSIVLLGFSLPLVAQIPGSNISAECQTPMPQRLSTIDDFISMGHFQEDCQKDSLAAVSSFTQAIKLNPKAEEPYYHRANAYAAIGNYKDAVADYTEVIRQNTGRRGYSSGAYWNRARAYEKLGEKQKAISDLTQLIGDSSPNVDEYLLRGNLYRDLGDKESAISDYKSAENILQQSLNGVFGTGMMDARYQKMLDKVRTELSQLGVSLPAPQLRTRRTLKAIAKMEVVRALNLARYTPQNPAIGKFDAQLQDLYKQLANSQPQSYKGTVENLILNAASEKLEGLEKERSELIKRVTPDNPAVGLIDEQKKQLTLLMNTNRKQFDALMHQD
ncbi:tetratricopeptide repeat protein [Nostoc flagelliforme FACHB-838]|uniref:Tetratricopeptide repeat protein n=1 Tax=Nostoc flagelliforme FACHB-838 TaxID=2692904 RepID=A0ABR8DZU5_9NOSO|nr:tetratricopeptide repeat protein [Nostoc flagelliforme]MBD2534931.1 tetratricopeptide repeat protein [Nostoc flagelliforme FACHB-838]